MSPSGGPQVPAGQPGGPPASPQALPEYGPINVEPGTIPNQGPPTVVDAPTPVPGYTPGPAEGITAEEAVQALERKALMSLFKTEASLARMQHMLDTGKPLRN